MIPVIPYRAIGAVIVLAAALATAAAGGAVVNGWRLDGDHQRAIATEKASFATLLAEYNDLKLSTTKQNGAVDILAVKAEASEVRRAQAEKYSAGIVASTERRIADIKASKETTCDGVLRNAWEAK